MNENEFIKPLLKLYSEFEDSKQFKEMLELYPQPSLFIHFIHWIRKEKLHKVTVEDIKYEDDGINSTWLPDKK